MSAGLEERKLAEIAWADKRRTIDPEDTEQAKKYLANKKYYSVVRRTTQFVDQWLRENCRGKDVFEMACGNGCYAPFVADIARSVTAADIAPLSIEQARERVKNDPVLRRINYQVLDCENTGLPDNSFDVLCEGGALHHMDLPAVSREAVRLLRPGGQFLCVEAIRHNPYIHLYRRMTPHLRTAWEADHILGRPEIMQLASHFERIELKLLHIATLAAVPLRKTPLFLPVLTTLEAVDAVLTRIPGFRWMAWQAVFVLSHPKK
jgi:ubiquinone/menaquinone biosynthesis C-methylase UbiE